LAEASTATNPSGTPTVTNPSSGILGGVPTAPGVSGGGGGMIAECQLQPGLQAQLTQAQFHTLATTVGFQALCTSHGVPGSGVLAPASNSASVGLNSYQKLARRTHKMTPNSPMKAMDTTVRPIFILSIKQMGDWHGFGGA
jgi:hypothetical protein